MINFDELEVRLRDESVADVMFEIEKDIMVKKRELFRITKEVEALLKEKFELREFFENQDLMRSKLEEDRASKKKTSKCRGRDYVG